MVQLLVVQIELGTPNGHHHSVQTVLPQCKVQKGTHNISYIYTI